MRNRLIGKDLDESDSPYHNSQFKEVKIIYAIWNNDTDSFHRDDWDKGHAVKIYTSKNDANRKAQEINSGSNKLTQKQNVEVIELTKK